MNSNLKTIQYTYPLTKYSSQFDNLGNLYDSYEKNYSTSIVNVIFKFDEKDQDKYGNISYKFRINDQITKSKAIELLANSKTYHDTFKNDWNFHHMNMPIYCGYKKSTSLKFKKSG